MPRWDMYGKPIETAEMAATVPVVTQRFQLPAAQPQSLLQGVSLGLILHSAIFTNISVELWSDRAGAPGALIAQSITQWTEAQIAARLPLEYKFFYAGFQFLPVSLRPEAWYHIAVRAAGYTGDATNHIAWRHSYADTQYTGGLTFDVEAIKATKCPLETLIYASEF